MHASTLGYSVGSRGAGRPKYVGRAERDASVDFKEGWVGFAVLTSPTSDCLSHGIDADEATRESRGFSCAVGRR